MRIDEPRRIYRPIPLIPLIDVVFLLLMFFMLSTTFAKFGQFGMSNSAGPAAGGAATANAVPGVIVDVAHGPDVRVNGVRVAFAGLVAKLNAFHKLGIRKGIVRPMGDADVQDLVTVLEMARTSRLSALALSQ
jgi:biopolymer transport protein ExbD